MLNFLHFKPKKIRHNDGTISSEKYLQENKNLNVMQSNKEDKTKESATRSLRKEYSEIFKSAISVLFLVLLIVLPIRAFIGKPFIVNGSSMDPSFHSWDYILVDVFTYQFLHPPKRGDVVVFKAPVLNGRYFIKRIIALPGESIEIKNGKVIIYNDQFKEGFELKENYIADANRTYSDMKKITLKKDEYFVMGDNRKGSYDSRYWGPLKVENIVGRAFLRLYPFTQIELWPASTNFIK